MACDTDIEMEDKDTVITIPKGDSLVMKLRRARKRYASTFTMHAVEHILNGNLAEKIFWSLKLSASLGTAIFLSTKLFTSFFHHDVDTKVIVETRDRLQFPMIMIGTPEAFSLVRSSYHNCSSNESVSFNEKICKLLNRDCPMSGGDNDSLSCDILGQFMVINADGKAYQTATARSLKIFIRNVRSSSLPLLLLIKEPSMRLDRKVDGGVMPKAWYEFVVIDKIGHYRFSLEKTTIIRLPYPYSNPSCIEQHSKDAKTKNIFRGNYSSGSCFQTCQAKSKIKFCRTMSTVARYFIRDERYLKEHFVDQPLASIKKCLKDKNRDIKQYLKNCVEECYSPCYEQTFRATEFYKKGEKGVIQLSFYYDVMKETYIRQVPSYEVETLLSNFGGQLGLMVGMSAVSFVELLVWSILLLLEYVCQLRMPRLTALIRSLTSPWTSSKRYPSRKTSVHT